MSDSQAVDLLAKAAAELAQIHRGRRYMEWREETVGNLGKALAATAPFVPLARLSILADDGKDFSALGRIGDWAIDQLVSKVSPAEILTKLADELARNRTGFVEVRSIANVTIDAPCVLSPTLEVAPAKSPLAFLAGEGDAQLAEVRQPYALTPAFVASDLVGQVDPGTQAPTVQQRADALPIVRYACLLAGAAPIAFEPLRVERDRDDLFTPPRLYETVPNTRAAPGAHKITAVDVKAIHAALGKFAAKEPLYRAIERLGRARRAQDPIDQALELGIAIEVAMTHGDKTTSEITFRLSTRLAWLLGETPTERQAIFKEAKALYAARSKAVHEGRLSSKTQPDLAAGDRLVTRALRALLKRAAFPDWSKLTMGAG